MNIGRQNLLIFAATTAIVAFFCLQFDAFPFPKTILAVIAAATVLHYSIAQNSTEKLQAKTRETFSRKIMMPFFILFMGFFFFSLLLQKLDLAVSAAGAALALLAAFFYSKSVLFLGKFYSQDAEIKQGHKLVKNGPYAVVRHPSYLCALFFYFGMALMANSLACAALLLCFFAPWTFYRISVEERMLSAEFGNEFAEYKRRVPALVPKLF